MTLHGAPGTDVDPSRLADGSRIADALIALGPNGVRALGHLRDARLKLSELDRWSQPLESTLASCRSAIDSLLKEAGEEFEGPRDAQKQVNREVKALLQQPAEQATALAKLFAALDREVDVPDVLEPRAGIGAGVQGLIRTPADRLPGLVDPRPEYDAELELLAIVAALETLPLDPTEQQALVAVLRRLQQARRDSGAAARTVRPDALAGLREAVAYQRREEQDGGAFRRRQLADIVRQRTGTTPGMGEQEAFRAWAKFYRQTSGVLHGSSGDGEASTRKLFADLVAHVEQLVLDLPALAPLLVPLVTAQAPTAADAEAVAALQQPRAIRYFFMHAVSPDWLDLISNGRLLPETAHWPAQPYLERIAVTDPQRALAWLTANQNAFGGADPEVLAGLLRVARQIGGSSAAIVLSTLAKDDVLLEPLWQLVVTWLVGVPVDVRDLAWVEVAKRVLLHVVENSAGQRWEIQQQLTELQTTAYSQDGPGDAAVVRAVRATLLEVTTAAVGAELELGDLDMADDLRQVVRADDFAPTTTRITVRSLLDLARTESGHGTALPERTAKWADLPGPPRWADRVLAAHLLETVPDRDPASYEAWQSAARDVLSRIGSVKQVGADTLDLVATVVDRCPPDTLPDLEALLTTALGTAPDPAGLEAGRHALANWPTTVPPTGWSTLWALSPVLPPAVLAPWQDVVDAVTELFGPAPRRPLPRIRFVPYLDGLTAAVQDLETVAVAQGAPAAAVALRERMRAGTLSPDYARIVVGRLVATDPNSWSQALPAVVAALEEPVLQHGYLAALRTPLIADPCPLTDPVTVWAAVTEALWNLVCARDGDPATGSEAQLTLCLIVIDAWTRDVDLGAVEQPVIQWLSVVVTAWTAPADPSAADPLKVAYGELGGLAVDAVIRWGLVRAAAPAELVPEAADVLGDLLDAGSDDRAMAVIGDHLPVLLNRAPTWIQEHRAQLLGLDRPHCPAVTAITSRHVVDDVALDVMRHLDRDQLVAYLRCRSGDEGGGSSNQVLWEACAGLLLLDPAALGGRSEFLELLAAAHEGAPAVSRLLGAAGWVLPRAATEANSWVFDNAVSLWHDVLGLGLPAEAGHLRGAGEFAYAKAMDDAVWLELTAATVERTPAISKADSVVRRAARHPDSEAAHRIVAGLLTQCDGTTPTTLSDYRLDEITREGIALWSATSAGTPGRTELGEALARHADFLEAVV
ncbi:hypothetical protein P3T27_008069 [Kitasatospora sp. MAA19]|uniref:hypothetical protein n=1 Tax=Kitasatospora sp. MAA19 TaxID=3035090 RepID=UPI002473DE6A|nr:hypothetical protein [Kitasatospora sp. MAA19]MDH6711311.1 hypothetical protein [Kitasatospora sp. MAA19]